jgi:class 3 adenylate cyclase
VSRIDAARRIARQRKESQRVLTTLLFTDIVDSTGHAERLGDTAWRGLLDQHHVLTRREVSRCNGAEVATTGDGFLARFDSPAQAIEAACAVRRAVEPLGLQIRAGVHTGECEVTGNTLAGMAVHIASRIQAAAAPGEVLVSSTVKALVVGSTLRFVDRGEQTLKGVPEAWRLYATTA